MRSGWICRPKELKIFSEEEAAELYRAYGLTADDGLAVMKPKIISTGLCDILLPVSGQEALERADQNESEVIRLSGKYGVVGVHLFWPSLKPGETAHCRNFAPLYAIPEEAATGTSNGPLPTIYIIWPHSDRCGKPLHSRGIYGKAL